MNATQLTHFYSFAGDGCGHTVLGPESGTLASINYPQTSPNSTVCEWEIRVKPGQRIQLKFGDLDIDDSDSCHSSYLRVHNGIGPTRTEIGKLFSVLESCCLVQGLEDSFSTFVTLNFTFLACTVHRITADFMAFQLFLQPLNLLYFSWLLDMMRPCLIHACNTSDNADIDT